MDIITNASLKKHNTFGIDAKARYFVEITSVEELQETLSFIKSNSFNFFILGGGSNVLFTKDFEGVVIKNNTKGIETVFEDDNIVTVKASAGESWSDFTDYCVSKGWSGIENLSLIPGSVGASPVQNIGAYGVEVKDVIKEVEVLDIETGEVLTIPAKDCKFGYRSSIFKNEAKGKYVVLSVIYKLSKHFEPKIDYGPLKMYFPEKKIPVTLKNVSLAVKEIRRSKLPDPGELGNAGSFFKNPVIDNDKAGELKRKFKGIPVFEAGNGKSKIAAGWMIEKTGWKGKRIGDAGVHEKQALVLVNYGNATGQEIVDLADKIKSSVFETFGINLENEVLVL